MSNNVKMGKCGCISSNIWVIQGDTRSQLVTISVPRIEGGVDLSSLAWYIKIENAEKVTDVCRPVDGSTVIDDKTIAFDWLICGIATECAGATRFSVEGVDETADGHPIVWRSAPGTIYVGENLDATPSEDEEAELSNLQKLIVYVDGELNNVIAAGNAAASAASAAETMNQNVEKAEQERAEKFAGYEGRIGEAEKLAQESVLYTPQTLTDAQQAQARENVGAASAITVNELKGDLSDKLSKSPSDWGQWSPEEQDAARERMGVSLYKTLVDVTLEEDSVPYFSFGENYRELFIHMQIPDSNQYDSYFYVRSSGGKTMSMVPKNYLLVPNTSKHCSIKIENIDGVWHSRVSSGNTATNMNNNTACSLNYGETATNVINIQTTFPKGARIIIKGVKA